MLTQWPGGGSVVRGHRSANGGSVAMRTAGLTVIEQLMLHDFTTYLPGDILVKVDRATMGVSLESRAPFLDHRIVELAWRIPLSMKVREGKGKWILRHLLERYVPRELTERPKMGFGVPLESWLRGPLRDWGDDLLEPARLAREGVFNPKPIVQAWSRFRRGGYVSPQMLWTVLMFQSWHESIARTSKTSRTATDGNFRVDANVRIPRINHSQRSENGRTAENSYGFNRECRNGAYRIATRRRPGRCVPGVRAESLAA